MNSKLIVGIVLVVVLLGVLLFLATNKEAVAGQAIRADGGRANPAQAVADETVQDEQVVVEKYPGLPQNVWPPNDCTPEKEILPPPQQLHLACTEKTPVSDSIWTSFVVGGKTKYCLKIKELEDVSKGIYGPAKTVNCG